MGELFHGPSGVDIQGIQENLLSDLKLGSQGSTLVVVSRHIVLRLREGGTGFIQCLFHLIGELIHGLDLRRTLIWFEAHVWMSTGVEEERGVLRRRVNAIVVRKFAKG